MRILSVISIILLILPPADIIASQLEEKQRIALSVAEGHQNNLDAIRTWRGRAEVTDYLYKEDGSVIELPKKASFWVDFATPAVRFEIQTQYEELDRSDEHLKQEEPFHIIGIIRPEKGLFFKYPNPLREGGSRGRVVIFPPESPYYKQHYEFTFDPRFYFTYGGGKEVRNFRTMARSTIPDDYCFKTRGNLIVIQGETNTYKFDSSKGYNLVYHNTDTGYYLQSEQIMNYIELSGAFVPSFAELKIADGPNLSERYVHRKVIFHDQAVNIPIDSEMFSLSGLPLRPGDEINDTILGEYYTKD